MSKGPHKPEREGMISLPALLKDAMKIKNVKKALMKQGVFMLGEHATIMTVQEGVEHLLRLQQQGKAKEPIFILRGQDKLAVATVFFWAQIAEKHGVSLKKVSGAWAHAEAMAGWSPRKLPD